MINPRESVSDLVTWGLRYMMYPGIFGGRLVLVRVSCSRIISEGLSWMAARRIFLLVLNPLMFQEMKLKFLCWVMAVGWGVV